MKIIHLSDLHLGKRLHDYSLIEDQKDILEKIIRIIENEKPDAVLVAGDVYDRSVPNTDAVELFDRFLVELAKRKQQVFIIGGNHDSLQRLSFANRLIDVTGIHIAGAYSDKITPVTLSDSFGEVNIYMLPFVRPADVRRFYPDEEIVSYTDALKVAIDKMNIDKSKRNVLITHQFVTGATRSESEDVSVGGSDNVDSAVFDGIDYVALGHLHKPQNVGPAIRYCGTPLKYSFSEKDDEKSVTVIELGDKGGVQINTVPLIPMRNMSEICGTYDELMSKSFYDGTPYPNDYLRIILKDENDVPNAESRLRAVYPYFMEIKYDNARTRNDAAVTAAEDVRNKSPLELFGELYEKQNGAVLGEDQNALLTDLIEEIWG